MTTHEALTVAVAIVWTILARLVIELVWLLFRNAREKRKRKV